MLATLAARLWRLLITPYAPQSTERLFLDRRLTQSAAAAEISVAVPSAAEAARLLGVDLIHRGIQPVHLRIENRGAEPLRLQPSAVDPRYFTPLEAASACHFSILRRLTAFGLLGWLFLPLVLLLPLKLVTARRANRRMDALFRRLAFRLGPIRPGESREGLLFTTPDLGTKVVRVRLVPAATFPPLPESADDAMDLAEPSSRAEPATRPGPGPVECDFVVSVPGIAADYLRRDLDRVAPGPAIESCSPETLTERLAALPSTTTGRSGRRSGDPLNLVIVADFPTLLSAFAARWDESESITPTTCWKTVRAFLLGTDYRYSPVSPLHLFGRSQDIALQRTRRSINERLHLRLWRAALEIDGRAVWVGQVSRDIGVRFTLKAWNLTTHRIDPDVDESRDYVIEDLSLAGRVAAAGYVGGVGASSADEPRRNLTGDPWHSDGNRAVIVLTPHRLLPGQAALPPC
jgi:hypothetical protein